MCIINSVALLDYPYYSYYDFNIITGVVLHLPERERESECVCLLCMHAYIHIIHANGDECTINQAESEAAAKVFLPEAMPRWLVERYHSPEVRSLRIRSPGTNAKTFFTLLYYHTSNYGYARCEAMDVCDAVCDDVCVWCIPPKGFQFVQKVYSRFRRRHVAITIILQCNVDMHNTNTMDTVTNGGWVFWRRVAFLFLWLCKLCPCCTVVLRTVVNCTRDCGR